MYSPNIQKALRFIFRRAFAVDATHVCVSNLLTHIEYIIPLTGRQILENIFLTMKITQNCGH